MVLSTTKRVERYDGNGSTTVFPFAFRVTDNAHLFVYRVDADDVSTQLTEGTDYTVSGVGDAAGGEVTYPVTGTPLPAGEKLVLFREVDLQQLVNFLTLGGFFPTTHEDLFDKVFMKLQELDEGLGRTVQNDITEGGDGTIYLSAILEAVDSAVAAQDAAIAAQGDAETAQTASEAARDKAQAWAEEVEDTEVETGKFSAKHWATKAIVNVALIEANVEKARKWAEELEDVPVEVGEFSALHHAAKASADAAATAADRVQTGLDAVATAADRVQTGLDATATAADVISTGEAREKARKWAEELEDVPVEVGKFSALHHAAKAAASAATVAGQVFANKDALDTIVPTTPGNFWRTNAAGTGLEEGSPAAAPVDSVNDKTGVVVLAHTDVGAAAAVHNHDGDYDAIGAASGAVGTHESTYTHADIASNTTARHSHTNKATLDAVPDHAAATAGHVLAKAAGGGLEFVEQTGGGTDLDTYTVTFNGNGNTAGTVPGAIAQVASHVVTLPLGTGLVNGGLAISEWNTAANGSGASYTLGGTYTFASATTLYAQYSAPITATGGTVTEVGGYKIHTFTSDGTFEVTDAGSDGEVEYLVVAGGGSGGNYQGGGGAGGLLNGTFAVSVGVYPVVVGGGGASVTTISTIGNNGENSSALGFTAVGGGGGGAGSNVGSNGGSGGGGGSDAAGGTGTSGQGNSGGSGATSGGSSLGGGGGGATSVGGNASTAPGNGGTGKTVWGSTYAGGGGGSADQNTSVSGDGGAGGGGKGGYNSGGWMPAESGGVNTGGGGGAAGYSTSVQTSGAGGSGIVIIRYPI